MKLIKLFENDYLIAGATKKDLILIDWAIECCSGEVELPDTLASLKEILSKELYP